jgi:hypothetical protein
LTGGILATESTLQELLTDFNALNKDGRGFLVHEKPGLAALCGLFAQRAQAGELEFRSALEDLANLAAGQAADAVSTLPSEAMTLMVAAFSSLPGSAACVRAIEHLKRHESPSGSEDLRREQSRQAELPSSTASQTSYIDQLALGDKLGAVLPGVLAFSPKTDLGWPRILPSHAGKHAAIIATHQPSTGKEYESLLQRNGRVIIGDIHDSPDGLLVLYHLLNTLPCTHLYVERGFVSSALDNAFMAWLKTHQQAPVKEKLLKMTETKEGKAGVLAACGLNFLQSKSFDSITADQATDHIVRWIELECAVSTLIASKNMAVSKLLDQAPGQETISIRDPSAWKGFTEGPGLKLLICGDSHALGKDARHPDCHDLLAASKGLFLRTAQSFCFEQMLDSWHLPKPEFLHVKPKPVGSWMTEVATPSIPSRGHGESRLGHCVFFSVYDAKTDQ